MARNKGVAARAIGSLRVGAGLSATRAAGNPSGYGSFPRTSANGLAGGSKGTSRILYPSGPFVFPGKPGNRIGGNGGRTPTPAADLFHINYTPNDPRQWPIEGGKIVQFDLAGKATRRNEQVNFAYARDTGFG